MFLPLYCVSFDLRLLITPSNFSCLYVLSIVKEKLEGVIRSRKPKDTQYNGKNIKITPSSFSCLFVLSIVLCVLRFTSFDYTFNLFLSLCSCHCIVCPSVYGFWLYLQAFLVCKFLPFYCVSFGLRLLIIPSCFSLSLCSCNCVVCSSVYGFWLPLEAFLVFMFLPLYCLSFSVRLLITPSNFSCLYVLPVVYCVLRFTACDYPFKLFFVFMFLQLYCAFFGVRLLITPSSFSCLYVLAIVLCVLRFPASDYPFKLFLSLCSSHCHKDKEKLEGLIRSRKPKDTQYDGKNIKTKKSLKG
jgi:hypothetical protein